jgi:hypothetical protein
MNATLPLADYAGEVLVAACGPELHLWRPLQHLHLDANDDVTHVKVPVIDNTKKNDIVQTAAWNRNNKVVAVASSDGSLQLRYGNGAFMTLLESEKMLHGATDLSWSLGSKRLAVASSSGLFVHDMGAKSLRSDPNDSKLAVLSNPGDFTAVAFHPEDRFLLAGGPNKELGLYSFQHNLVQVSALAQSSSTIKSVDIAADAQSLIAAGSQDGSVAIWDCTNCTNTNGGRAVKLYYSPHSRERALDTECNSVRFLPLAPSMLISINSSGDMLLHDLRSSSRKPHEQCLSICKDALTSLAIREDLSCLATGTRNGQIHLLDLRQNQNASWKTIECRSGWSVTCVDWQHRYQNLGTRVKEVVGRGETEVMVEHVRNCLGVGHEDFNLEKNNVDERQRKEVSARADSESRSQAESLDMDGISNPSRMAEANLHSRQKLPSPPWSIKANGNITTLQENESRSEQPPSPSKQPKKATAPDVSNQAVGINAETLQKDILALHLDMLTQFKEHQEIMSSLVSDMLSKQKDLEAQVEALRAELRDLLSRRDGILWL